MHPLGLSWNSFAWQVDTPPFTDSSHFPLPPARRVLPPHCPRPREQSAITATASATCHAVRCGEALGVSFATDYTVTMTGWGEVQDKCGGGLLDNLRGDCKGSVITGWTCAIDGSGNAVATWRMPRVRPAFRTWFCRAARAW